MNFLFVVGLLSATSAMSTWRPHAAHDITYTRGTLCYMCCALAFMLSTGFLALTIACHADSLLFRDFRDTSIIAHMFQRSNRLKDVVSGYGFRKLRLRNPYPLTNKLI